MATCTSCGSDVTGMKFCQQCGTPVQQATSTPTAASTSFCPNCGQQLAPGMHFCPNCGSQVGADANPQASQPQPQPGQPDYTQAGQYPPQPQPQQPYQTQYGQPAYGQPGQQPPYDPSQYAQQPAYGQPQYPQQAYGQPQPQYPQYQQQPAYPQQYPQGGYGSQQPMMGQQPMILRCPTCMAMSPLGTASCPSCRTSLAGVVPTPAVTGAPGQQGGLGGMFQGNAGNMAMGALGGAAAVIGGEMLLGGLERRLEGDEGYGYGEHHHHHHEEGMLGELGELGRDIGLL